jgi:hypothetical protein
MIVIHRLASSCRHRHLVNGTNNNSTNNNANSVNLVLFFIGVTMSLNIAEWIDPFCQLVYNQNLRNTFSILSIISVLVSMMLMIRTLSSTYVKVQPLKRKSVKLLNTFFSICAFLFIFVCISFIISEYFASNEIQSIFGLFYIILSILFVVILNIGGCWYISSTLSPLTKVSPLTKTSPKNNSSIRTITVVISPPSSPPSIVKLVNDGGLTKPILSPSSFFNNAIAVNIGPVPLTTSPSKTRDVKNKKKKNSIVNEQQDKVRIAATRLLKAMRGAQVASTLGATMFLGISIKDPQKHDLVLQFVVEFMFRVLIVASCFFITRSIGHQGRRNRIHSGQAKIVDDKPPLPQSPVSPASFKFPQQQ